MKQITHDEVKLLHAEYDPVKAHEYYLRNRELKGKQPTVAKPTPMKRFATAQAPAPAKKTGAQYARKPLLNKKPMNTAQAKARVAGIQKRLGALENVLKDLMKQRAAIKPKKTAAKKTAAKKTATKAEPKRQLTSKQQSDNRERSKQYYEDHKDPAKPKAKDSAKDSAKELDRKIALVKDQIKKTKVELAVAKVKAGIK